MERVRPGRAVREKLVLVAASAPATRRRCHRSNARGAPLQRRRALRERRVSVQTSARVRPFPLHRGRGSPSSPHPPFACNSPRPPDAPPTPPSLSTDPVSGEHVRDASRGCRRGVARGRDRPLMAGTSAPSGGFRDAHLDNCKFFLMCAVVFNHCFQDYFEYVLDPTTGREWCARDPRSSSAPPGRAPRPPPSSPSRARRVPVPQSPWHAGVYLCQRPLHPRLGAGGGAGRRLEPRLAISTRGANLTRALRHLADLLPPVQLRRRLPGAGVVARRRHVVPERALRVARIVPYLARLRGRVPALFLVGLAVGFTDTPVTENGLPFLDFQRLVAFAPFFYLGVESSSRASRRSKRSRVRGDGSSRSPRSRASS